MAQALRRLVLALVASALLAGIAAAAAMAAPGVTTEEATEVTATTATLHATVDTHGSETLAGFEYGTTTKYGSYPDQRGQLIPAGEKSPVHIGITIKSLTPNTTYYFRALAVGEGSGTFGNGLSFKTQPGVFMSESGAKFDSYAYPVHFSATPTPTGKFRLLGGEWGEFNCKAAGTGTSTTNKSALKFNEFSECKAPFGSTIKLRMNSCSYEFQAAESAGGKGHVAVSCTKEGDKVELVAYGLCTIKVGPQSLSGSEFDPKNISDATVEVNSTSSSVHWEPTKTEANDNFCSLFKGNQEQGTFAAEVSLSGTFASAPTNLGVFMSESKTKFDADNYPVHFSATPTPTGKFRLLGGEWGEFNCKAAGAGTTSAKTSALKFNEFSECKAPFGSTIKLRMNSCSYEFQAAESAGGKGHVAVSCTKEGDKVELVAYGLCTIKVGPQSLSGSEFDPKNEGAGSAATVEVNSTSSSVHWEPTKTEANDNFCSLFKGNQEQGTFAAEVSLSGTYAG